MVVYGICAACEFEVSAPTLDELDSKFKRHFTICGHDTYFCTEKLKQRLRKIS